MTVELGERDVERATSLDEILASPGAKIVDAHGHEAALSGEVASFFRAAVATARGSGKALLFSPDDTMSPAQAAELLGVSRPMIYRYIEDGLLEDRPVNTYHRIPVASVHLLIEERRSAARHAAQLLRDDPDHPRVAAARERVRARRAARDA